MKKGTKRLRNEKAHRAVEKLAATALPKLFRRKSRIRCPGCKSKRLEVWQRRCNYSAFNGYRWTPSDYSGVKCKEPRCGRYWRTRADVSHLPDAREAAR